MSQLPESGLLTGYMCINQGATACMSVRETISIIMLQVNQKLLYRESDWWDVGLVVQKARQQGTVC